MAKNLASVKPVTGYGWIDPGKNTIYDQHARYAMLSYAPSEFYNVPCTLLTTARYKRLLAVVKAAVADKKAGDAADANPKGQAEWKEYERRITELRAAIKAAEKAGAL